VGEIEMRQHLGIDQFIDLFLVARPDVLVCLMISMTSSLIFFTRASGRGVLRRNGSRKKGNAQSEKQFHHGFRLVRSSPVGTSPDRRAARHNWRGSWVGMRPARADCLRPAATGCAPASESSCAEVGFSSVAVITRSPPS